MEKSVFSTVNNILSLDDPEQEFRSKPILMLEAAVLCSENGYRPSNELYASASECASGLFVCKEPFYPLFARLVCGEYFYDAALEFPDTIAAVVPELGSAITGNAFSPYRRAIQSINGCGKDVTLRLAVLFRSVCADDTATARSALSRLAVPDDIERDVLFILENRREAALWNEERRREFAKKHGERRASLMGDFITAIRPVRHIFGAEYIR